MGFLWCNVRRGTKKVTANRTIENQEERLVKGLSILVVGIVTLARPHHSINVLSMVVVAIDVPANLLVVPFNRKVVVVPTEIHWVAAFTRAMKNVVWPTST